MLDLLLVLQVEKLIKAGANILMPVVIGDGQKSAVGTAVDYAHHSFNQVLMQRFHGYKSDVILSCEICQLNTRLHRKIEKGLEWSFGTIGE